MYKQGIEHEQAHSLHYFCGLICSVENLHDVCFHFCTLTQKKGRVFFCLDWRNDINRCNFQPFCCMQITVAVQNHENEWHGRWR